MSRNCNMALEYHMPIEFHLGHQEIDRQHDVIYSLYNYFIGCNKTDREHNKCHETLSSISKYVIVHCNYEEELMKNIVYSKRDDHIIEHLQLIEITRIFQDRIDKDPDNNELIASYGEFFIDWFQHHVCITDRELINSLRQL
ncbi:bacteriohemerythrin [Candidatus Magnetaquicoccus inordinatus]|uniref:bacteriohemerythrin n=1 Tax=Candidatus Magnetaquicoccus inordinatus TaxID=2496818 RepID=UPI00102AE8ED|nr:hemerythrin family protein [Candidatus Magnetaquicoccus inordinatus]